MNPTHDQLLADLEARVRRAGSSVEEVDGRVAVALGVGVREYRTYLAVRGALEARRQPVLAAGCGGTASRPSGASAPERLAQQLEVIGGLVALLYQRASDAGDRHGVSAAARILATLPNLRHTLATLAAGIRRRPPRRVRRG